MAFAPGIIVLVVFLFAAIVPCVYLCACNLTIILAFVSRQIFRDKDHLRQTEKEKEFQQQIKVKRVIKQQKEKKKKQKQKAVIIESREMDEYIDEDEDDAEMDSQMEGDGQDVEKARR